MTNLILNSSTFSINGYNRYTNIDETGAHSSATVNFTDNSRYDALTQVGEIHSLEIQIDGEMVYSLDNIRARITNVNEYLSDKGVTMTAQISFDVLAE